MIELRILADIAHGRPPGPQTSVVKLITSIAEQVREVFHMTQDPHPEWQLLALEPGGEWLGLTVMVRYGDMAHNKFTAVLPQARGRGHPRLVSRHRPGASRA